MIEDKVESYWLKAISPIIGQALSAIICPVVANLPPFFRIRSALHQPYFLPLNIRNNTCCIFLFSKQVINPDLPK